MAATPYYKVHTFRGYVASFKYIEDAAAFTACIGEGTTIRSRWGRILWQEGKESQPAIESYDHVAEVAQARDGGTINPHTT